MVSYMMGAGMWLLSMATGVPWLEAGTLWKGLLMPWVYNGWKLEPFERITNPDGQDEAVCCTLITPA